jgi:hypothetical protein
LLPKNFENLVRPQILWSVLVRLVLRNHLQEGAVWLVKWPQRLFKIADRQLLHKCGLFFNFLEALPPSFINFLALELQKNVSLLRH